MKQSQIPSLHRMLLLLMEIGDTFLQKVHGDGPQVILQVGNILLKERSANLTL